jgi:phosphate transport system permease protein
VSATTFAQPRATARISPRGVLPKWGPPALYGTTAVVALGLIAGTGIGTAVVVVAAALASGTGLYVWSRTVEGRRTALDRLVTHSVTCAFVLAVAPLLSLLWTVTSKGIGTLDIGFFTESQRNVIGEGGGAEHAILGTLIITACATVVSVPIGIMAAIYMQEYGRGRLRQALTFFVDVMTGIPSIVAGLFAYAVFAVILGPGVRLGIIGAVALSVLMVPIVVRSTEEMLRVVPDSLREASYALGVPKWRTIVSVVLPTALAGIVTGVMLAVARIIGETAPLLITAGVVDSINTDPFNGRMQNLAVFAFNEYKSPGVPPQPAIDRAWAAALTLLIIVMLLNLIARVIYRRFGTRVR